MNFVQLRCLVALADADLRLSVAADYARVSERVLLEHLKQIEEELGLPIVLRRGRRVDAITRAGTGIIRRARVVLDGVAGIQAFGAYAASGRHNRLVISATHTQAKYILPAALFAFRAPYPKLTVLMREPRRRDGEQTPDNCADLVLHSTSGALPSHGVAVPLYRWQRWIVVPRDHALASADLSLTLSGVAAFPLVSYHLSSRRTSSLQRAFANAGVTPQISITTLNADLVKTYVASCGGVGIVPEMALTEEDRAQFACRVLPDVPHCVTWAVVPRDSPVSDSTLQLVRLLAPHLIARPLRPILEGKTVEHWTDIPDWTRAPVSTPQPAGAALEVADAGISP